MTTWAPSPNWWVTQVTRAVALFCLIGGVGYRLAAILIPDPPLNLTVPPMRGWPQTQQYEAEVEEAMQKNALRNISEEVWQLLAGMKNMMGSVQAHALLHAHLLLAGQITSHIIIRHLVSCGAEIIRRRPLATEWLHCLLQERDELVSEIIRYVLFRSYAKNGRPIAQSELSDIVNKKYPGSKKGLAAPSIKLAQSKLLEVFGMELRTISRTAPSAKGPGRKQGGTPYLCSCPSL